MKMLYFPKKSLTNKAEIWAKYLLIGDCQTCLETLFMFFSRKAFFVRKENNNFFQTHVTIYLPSFALKYQRISGFGQPSKIPGSLKHPKVR
jgi:hypothetical protein